MAKRKGFMMYFEMAEAISKMPAEDVKRLLLDMYAYAEAGRVPDYSDDYALDMIWCLCRARLDDDAERYAQTVQKRKEAINKRWDQERSERGGSSRPRSEKSGNSQMRRGPEWMKTNTGGYDPGMDRYLDF